MKPSYPRSIWVFTTEFEPNIIGGLGTAATHLTKAYLQKQVQPTVISTHRSINIQNNQNSDLHIIRFPDRFLSSKKPSEIHAWLMKRGFKKPDGIHIHSLQFQSLAKYYRTKHAIPLIYTCHSIVALESGSKKYSKMMLRQVSILKIADRIVVPSRTERKKLIKVYPFCAKKTNVIRHGVSISTLKRHGNKTKLLYVGRLISLKGIEPLIRAVALLRKNQPNVSLDVIGDGSEKYKRKLTSLVKRLRLQQNVKWLGFHKAKTVRRMYSSYGAVIMPSRAESFGLVALEALASGVPLVSTRSGGLSEFVNPNVAQTIPNVNAASIAKSIHRMWKNPKTTRRRVAAGRKLASRYRWSYAAVHYLKLFQQIQRTVKRKATR